MNFRRNLTENEDLVLESLPPPILLQLLGIALCAYSSPDPALHAAAATFVNLANGPPEVQTAMCVASGVLNCLAIARDFAVGPVARAPAAGCVLGLAKGDPRRCKEMVEASIFYALGASRLPCRRLRQFMGLSVWGCLRVWVPG